MPAAVASTAGVERVDAVRVDVPATATLSRVSAYVYFFFYFELMICQDDATYLARIKSFKGLWSTRGCILRGAASSGGTACRASPDGRSQIIIFFEKKY